MNDNEPQPVVHHKCAILMRHDLIVVEDLCWVRLLRLVENLVRVVSVIRVDVICFE